MKFVKQPQSLNVNIICDEFCKTDFRHSELLPNSVRCIICGPSNCGKTNLLISLLLHENGLRFRNVYIYSKTLYQPKYIFLEKVLQRVSGVTFQKYQENEEILRVQDAKPDSVIIFDDVACENQNNMRDYFAMGRHKYIDCFYLNQTYSKIPKQLIRDNANLIILFKQDEINLKHIYEEHVNTDMSWVQFREMCSKIWNDPFSFVVINKDCSKNKGCYRNKFDTFVVFD
nr:TPA_asm: FtsK [Spodoptera moth adintovirus 1]